MRYRHKRQTSVESTGTRAAHIGARVPGPLTARYLDEDDGVYLVAEPRGERTAQVAKRREVVEPFPPTRRGSAPGVRLLHWSAYALVGAVCGGVPGVVLGSMVTLLALVRLGQFSRRVRRWWLRQSRSDGRGGVLQLPAAVTAERLRLLAALGQGLLAVLLGCLVFLALSGLL